MQCPSCSKEISDSAKVCGYCGHQLKAPPVKCPDCGRNVREGAKVCGYCGHRFVESVPEPSPETQPETIPEQESVPEEQVDPSPPPPEETEKPTESPPKPETVPATPQESKPEPFAETPASPSAEAPKKSAILKEKTEKAVEKKQTGRSLPVWGWGLIGLFVIAAIAATSYFTTNRLPQQVTEILPDAKVVMKENFNSDKSPNFRTENINVSVNNGRAQLKGNGNFLGNLLAIEEELDAGDGVLALFQIEPDNNNEEWWVIQLYTKKYGNYYASVGFSEWYHPYTDILEEGYDTNFKGVRTAPKHGEWYYVLFAITSESEITVRVWQKDDPSQLSEHTWRLEPKLRRRKWIPAFSAHVGNMYVDSVKLISFPVE